MVFGWGHRRASSASAPARAAVVKTSVRALQGINLSHDKMAKMSGEKREGERVPLVGEVKGEVMLFQPMTILDIAHGGAQIETSFALQLDSLHDFRLTLAHRSLVVKGRIVHCHIEKLTETAALYRTGLEFVDLTEPARNLIADFVWAITHSRTDSTVVEKAIDADRDDSR